jgi:hypothetical protein
MQEIDSLAVRLEAVVNADWTMQHLTDSGAGAYGNPDPREALKKLDVIEQRRAETLPQRGCGADVFENYFQIR